MTSRVRRRRIAMGGAVLISGCMLLAACSSGASQPSGAAARPVLGLHAAPRAAGVPANFGSGSFSYGKSAARTVVETAGLTPATQSIIYTASLTLRSSDVAAAAKQAIAIVVAAGGYTAGEQASGRSSGRSSRETVSLTLKVPVPSYQAVLAQLSAPTLGKQLAMQQHATDVTQQVADVNSLVISEQDAIAALEGLLRKASSVPGLLQVQQQISQDQSYLNSLLSQQRALNQETSYATITMLLLSVNLKVHHKRPPATHGFLTGLKSGWRALRRATAWVLTAFGTLLPFLILILVLGSIGYLGWRRLGSRRAAPRSRPTAPGDADGQAEHGLA